MDETLSVSAEARREQLNRVTERIIGCAYRVANTLGHGFLEKVYENALAYELQKAGLRVLQQQGIQVRYEGVVVGEYVVDLLVEGSVIVELKAAKALVPEHQAQLINYLNATGLDVGLLVNFGGPRLEYRRCYGRGERDEHGEPL